MQTTHASTSPAAYLAAGRDKNRLKIYGNQQVYLKDGQDYMIEIYNPTQGTVGAKVFIDGKVISERMIMLRPGERQWLQRYIDTDNKFVFSTYNVDDTKETKNAISNNGKIKIEFYNEYTVPVYKFVTTVTNFSQQPPMLNQPYYGTNPTIYTHNIPDSNNFHCGISMSMNPNQNANGLFCDRYKNTITQKFNVAIANFNNVETGRTGKGEASGQNLSDSSGSFCSLPFHSCEYRILPVSQQPVEVNQMRQYCTGCGIRIRKDSWKFCPGCGSSLD